MAKPRVQVQGLGEAPTVKPVGLPKYQHKIAQPVAAPPKILQFAGDLAQAGLLVKGYAGYKQQEAARDIELEKAQAAQFQEEQREQEKFDQVLLKQHINNATLPSLNSIADSLINVETYTKREQASQAIDDAINKEWSVLSEKLGDDVAGSLASKALWNSVIPQYKQKLLAQYEKNREGFITDSISSEIGTYLEPLLNRYDEASEKYIIDELGIKNAVKIFDERLAEQLPNLTKPQRSQFLVDNFSIKVDGLHSAQRYTDAARMLSVLKTVELNGAPIFETTGAEAKLNQIEARINRSVQSYSEKKDTKRIDVYTNTVSEVIKGLMQVTSKEQLDANPILKEEIIEAFSFQGLGNGKVLTQEVKEAAINDIFDPQKPGLPVQKFRIKLKELARLGGEPSRDHLMRGMDEINEKVKDALETPFDPVVLDTSTKQDIIENDQYGLRKQKQLNPRLSLYEFRKNHPIKFEEFPELRQEFAILDRGSYVYDLNAFKGAKDTIDNKLSQVDAGIIDRKGITDTNEKNFIKSLREAYVTSIISDVQNDLIEQAKLPEVIDSDNQERAITEKLNEIIATNIDRYKGQTETILDLENQFGKPFTKEESDVELETEVKLRKTRKKREAELVEFKSLQKPKMISKKVGKRSVSVPEVIGYDVIKQDRQKMMEGGSQTRSHLRMSLARHGFQSWNPAEAVPMLDQAKLSFRDVKLFGSYTELNKVIERWLPVMYKDIGFIELEDGSYKQGDVEPMTDDEIKIREEYQSFGLVPLSEADILQQVLDGPEGFEEAQISKLK